MANHDGRPHVSCHQGRFRHHPSSRLRQLVLQSPADERVHLSPARCSLLPHPLLLIGDYVRDDSLVHGPPYPDAPQAIWVLSTYGLLYRQRHHRYPYCYATGYVLHVNSLLHEWASSRRGQVLHLLDCSERKHSLFPPAVPCGRSHVQPFRSCELYLRTIVHDTLRLRRYLSCP